MMMVSFNLGQQANFNDGITSALILFGSVFILILSYIFYNEKISIVETIGITVIISGVVVISIFKG
jgi:multidrug transporter EmrE-like cation transporter